MEPYDTQSAYAAPKAELLAQPAVSPDRIEQLSVSESWKRRFRLIERAGGANLPKFREMAFGERFGLQFNVLGFLFGPFYYLAKGLWRQAISYTALFIVLLVIVELMGLGVISRGIGYGFAAVWANRACVSYYKKQVLNAAPWF